MNWFKRGMTLPLSCDQDGWAACHRCLYPFRPTGDSKGRYRCPNCGEKYDEILTHARGSVFGNESE